MPKTVLRIVPPAAEPPDAAVRRRVRVAAASAELRCRCGSRDAVAVVTGASLFNGRVSGGVKQWLCAACLMQGRRVVLA